MALWQKTVASFSEHKGGVGSFLKIPRSNSVDDWVGIIRNEFYFMDLRWPTLISVAQRSAHCRHSTL